VRKNGGWNLKWRIEFYCNRKLFVYKLTLPEKRGRKWGTAIFAL